MVYGTQVDYKKVGVLKSMFVSDPDQGIPNYNKLVLWGKVEHKCINGIDENIIKIKKWNLLYPIQRDPIRGFYAPKGYFTIYDYNWIEVIKDLFKHK